MPIWMLFILNAIVYLLLVYTMSDIYSYMIEQQMLEKLMD